MTAIRQTTRLQTHERASTGGSASQPPTIPSTIPIQATVRKPCGRRAAPGRRLGRRLAAARSSCGRRLSATNRRRIVSTITSAPTKSTTSPWIRSVRFDASSGWKIEGSRLRVDVPLTSAAKSSAESPTPTAVLRPSRATAIPTKPICEARDVARRDVELPAEDVERSGKAGEHAGDRHREHVVARDVDAPVAGRLRVEADRLDAEAERRPVEDDPVDDEGRERDEDPDREALEVRGSPQKTAASRRRRCRSRSGSTASCDVLQRPAEAEEELPHPDRDPVEHDRRDHLVRPGGRLQEAGDPGPRGPGDHRDRDREHDVDERVQAGERRADPDGEERAHEVLALAADVEHPAAEGEGHGEARQDQPGRDQERLLEVGRGRRVRAGPVSTGTARLRPEPSKIAL